jgi:membrane-bound ClpP family serine protease
VPRLEKAAVWTGIGGIVLAAVGLLTGVRQLTAAGVVLAGLVPLAVMAMTIAYLILMAIGKLQAWRRRRERQPQSGLDGRQGGEGPRGGAVDKPGS